MLNPTSFFLQPEQGAHPNGYVWAVNFCGFWLIVGIDKDAHPALDCWTTEWKKKRSWMILPERVFQEAIPRFWENQVRRGGILMFSCLVFGCLMYWFCFQVESEGRKKVRRKAEEDKSARETIDPMLLTCLPLIYLLFPRSKLTLRKYFCTFDRPWKM